MPEDDTINDVYILHSTFTVPIIKQREPFCEDLRVHLWTEYQWNVFCDCYGQFKPIQCYEDICWCSDEQGYQIGKEVTFEGSDTL